MPVGDLTLPKLYVVKGIKIGITESYVRYKNRRDLVIFQLDKDTTTAAVFTKNAFSAAPVQVAKVHLQQSEPAYLLINTGNANAGTGILGLQNAQASCDALANITHCNSVQILPFSTGVIGEQLNVERMISAMPKALEDLSDDHWAEAAVGIMTTDTVPKGASEHFELEGIKYTITGISKGAGMIRPNMATMLAYVAMDVPVSQAVLKVLLNNAVNVSFNRITIDGDTSTNDSCVLMATGQAGGARIESMDDPRIDALSSVINRVFTHLAQLIVRDGEGATKFITVKVDGGKTAQESADVAYSVAHSPLIKTAFFASDPNWGRILAAVGKAGVEDLDVNGVQVWLDDVQICRNGGAAEDYTEAQGAAVMQQPEITIHIDLGRGDKTDTVWTCDLSYDYVKINADYRS